MWNGATIASDRKADDGRVICRTSATTTSSQSCGSRAARNVLIVNARFNFIVRCQIVLSRTRSGAASALSIIRHLSELVCQPTSCSRRPLFQSATSVAALYQIGSLDSRAPQLQIDLLAGRLERLMSATLRPPTLSADSSAPAADRTVSQHNSISM